MLVNTYRSWKSNDGGNYCMEKNVIVQKPQRESDLPTLRLPSDEIMTIVRNKLREQTYKHYVD